MRKKWIIGSILVFIFLLAIYGAWYLNDVYPPMEEAIIALESTSEVTVEARKDMVIFTPKIGLKQTGLIFYPGGKVDFRAYAPTAKEIAAQGYKTTLLKVPFSLAIFDINAADRAIKESQEIKKWVFVGHSLGGVAAEGYVYDHPDQAKGIIFLASYPSKDLKTLPIQSLTLLGSVDGVIDQKKLNDNNKFLPQKATITSIEGGNHSQFGYYGFQKGDQKALISREKQQKEEIQEIIKIMDLIEEEKE